MWYVEIYIIEHTIMCTSEVDIIVAIIIITTIIMHDDLLLLCEFMGSVSFLHLCNYLSVQVHIVDFGIRVAHGSVVGYGKTFNYLVVTFFLLL